MLAKQKEALRRYRLEADAFRDGERAPANAVFVTCSESHQAAQLAAATEPRCLVMNLGAVPSRAEIELAVGSLGARHVVLCGHDGCSAAHGGREHLLAQAQAVEAMRLGARVHVLWFDEREGDIHAWDADARRFRLLGDEDVAALFERLSGTT